MPGLLETASALAITAVMVSSTLAALAGAARVSASATELTGELFAARQLEHLFDRAALGAGGGPGHPAPVAAADTGHVVFHADLDGDGHVAATGSETTTLELSQHAGGVRIRHRLGKQTMTLLDLKDASAEIVPLDLYGQGADAATTTLIVLRVEPGDPAAASALRREWWVAVPAAVWP